MFYSLENNYKNIHTHREYSTVNYISNSNKHLDQLLMANGEIVGSILNLCNSKIDD